jgi:phenylacetic acid degradation operon negative regulatory protein
VKYDAFISSRQQFVEDPIPPTLAPVVGARRDGSASADTSSGLLLSLMGELMLPNEGVAWTQTIIDVLERLDVREKASRQALARMADRGWLARERVGRQTRWSLTDRSRALLVPGAERIYSFGRRPRVWDGRWLVLLASVRETERNVRYRMRVELSWAGFGSIGQGTWLCPWTQQEPTAIEILQRLDVDATSFVARLGGIGSATDLAAAAWDLPELRAAYETFLAETVLGETGLDDRGVDDRGVDDRDLDGGSPDHGGPAAASALVALVHRWRRFPFLDPDLPADLLPAGWPAPAAVRRFADVRADLSPRAQRWWRRRQVDLDPAGVDERPGA